MTAAKRHTPGGTIGRGFEQSTGTPAEFTPFIEALFDGPPDLDPFGMPGQVVRAARILVLPEHGDVAANDDFGYVTGDAWEEDWEGNVYGNPPYDSLGRALAKAYATFRSGRGQVLFLVPFRSHRSYWEPFAWSATAICYLRRPVVYLGHENAFSMACVFLYYGHDPARFRRVFSPLGRVEILTSSAPRLTIPTMTAPMPSGEITVDAIVRQHMKQAASDVLALNADKSWSEILQTVSDDLREVLSETPLRELFSEEVVAVTPLGAPFVAPEAPAPKRSANGNGRKKAPTNGRRKAAKKAANGNGHKKASKKAAKNGASPVGKFLSKHRLKPGDTFKSEQFIEFVGKSRSTAMRMLGSDDHVVRRGQKRGMYWEVL